MDRPDPRVKAGLPVPNIFRADLLKDCESRISLYPSIISKSHYAPAITCTVMVLVFFKTAGRAALRRPHLPGNNIPRRPNSNSSQKTRGGDVDPTSSPVPVPNTVPILPIWHRLGPISRGFQAYGRSQRKRPYTTQFASSLVIYVLGDLSAQNINGDEYDPARTVRALIISAGSSIPSYKWYVTRLLKMNEIEPS